MAHDDSNDIRLDVPPQVACPHCGVAVDTEGQAPFATVACAACHKNFILPIPFGPLLLLEQLGAGGMGAVFKGYDPGLKRPLAVKVMRRELGQRAEFVQQFEHEAQMLAALNNPNVVQVYSNGTEQGQPFIAMELVDHGRLDLVMHEKGPLDEKFAIRVAMDVVHGLRAAAAIGLAHGDLKPQNILFDRKGQAKVVDFGLARFKGEKKETVLIWGTPYYIAPEVIRGKQPNLSADIYSLGCTLFHALIGRPPFDKGSIEETVLARLKEKPPVMRDIRPELHEETAAVIARMMEVEAARRYPNYDSLLVDMLAAQKIIEQSPATSKKPLKKKSARGWWLVSSTVSALVLIAFWFIAGNKKQTAPSAPIAPVPETPRAETPAEKTEPVAPAPAPQRAAEDKAANYTEWKDGSTGGTGFGPWMLQGAEHAGFFLGSSTKNPGTGKAWGLYASEKDTASASRHLAGPLAAQTQRFNIDFDHGKIEKGGSAGIGLQNAATNDLWEFYLSGGTYKIHNAAGQFDTGLQKCEEGMRIEFRLKNPSNYSVRVVCGTETNAFSGRLAEDPDQAISMVRLWNYSAGPGPEHDVFFNNMEIVPVRVK